MSQLSGDSGVGSEEELSCPVFDLLKQGEEEDEEEEDGPLYENLNLNSPALSLPPPLQVNHLTCFFHWFTNGVWLGNIFSDNLHHFGPLPVQRWSVGEQLGGAGGGPQPHLDKPEPGQDRCQDFAEEEGDQKAFLSIQHW